MSQGDVNFASAYWGHIDYKLAGSRNLYKDLWGSNRKARTSPEIQKIRAANCRELLAAPFNQPSEIRKDGYKMWDFILASHAQGVRSIGKPVRYSDTQAEKKNSTNGYWYNDVWKKYVYQDHGDLDDKSAGCLDFQSREDSWQLIDLAAQVAYKRGDMQYRKSAYWEDYASLSQLFAQAIADITVAVKLGLPLDLTKKNPLPYGIVARPSLRAGFSDESSPLLQEPITPGMSIDENLIYICVAIEAGPDPLCTTTRAKTYTKDCAWSYLPKKAFLAGWETAAWVSLSTFASLDRIGWSTLGGAKAALTTHCRDLIQFLQLQEVVRSLAENCGPLPLDYQRIDYWVEKDVHKSQTDVVPNESCFLVNDSADGTLNHPSYSKKFIRMAKKGEVKSEDQLELEEYKSNLFLAFNSIRSARREYYVSTYPSVIEARSRRNGRKEYVKKVRRLALERKRRR